MADSEGCDRASDSVRTPSDTVQWDGTGEPPEEIFKVRHRPERVSFSEEGCLWDGCKSGGIRVRLSSPDNDTAETNLCQSHITELRERDGVSVRVVE